MCIAKQRHFVPESCQESDNELWKKESVSFRDDIAFILHCRIYSKDTRLPFFPSYCIKNSEAHIAIPGSTKILRIELLNDVMEVCAVKEKLVIDGTDMRLEQHFECDPYRPSKQDPMRVYLACDPLFGHPVIVLMLKPFRKSSIGNYLESFFYGWCASIVLSAALMLLIIGCKPEMIVVQHNEMSDRDEKSKKHRSKGAGSMATAITLARLKALANLRAKSKKSTPMRDSGVKEKEAEGTPRRLNKEETPNQSGTESPLVEKKSKQQESNEKVSRNQKVYQRKQLSETKAKYGTVKDKSKERKKAKQTDLLLSTIRILIAAHLLFCDPTAQGKIPRCSGCHGSAKNACQGSPIPCRRILL
ncbi:hypothetical protein Aduo_013874 [Ancylostoma duodenale]